MGWLPWCPTVLSGSQLPMKTCFILLSHLGKLHEPPIPKPRGTPKLSERYAGPEGIQGPGRGKGSTLGSGRVTRPYDPPAHPPEKGWGSSLGTGACAHIPFPVAPLGPPLLPVERGRPRPRSWSRCANQQQSIEDAAELSCTPGSDPPALGPCAIGEDIGCQLLFGSCVSPVWSMRERAGEREPETEEGEGRGPLLSVSALGPDWPHWAGVGEEKGAVSHPPPLGCTQDCLGREGHAPLAS